MYNECGEDPEIQKTPLRFMVAAAVILCAVIAAAVGLSMWGMHEIHTLISRVAHGASVAFSRRNADPGLASHLV